MPTFRRRIGLLLATAATVLALAGCGPGSPLADPGPQQTQHRDASGVTAVRLETSGSLTVTSGDSPSLTIHAGAAVIDRLTSEVHGAELTLGLDGSVARLGTVRYDLVVPRLTALSVDGSGDADVRDVPADSLILELRGSGDIKTSGLDLDGLVVRIAGSGNVDAAGRTGSQDVRIDGSGDYQAAELASENATVSVAGSGDADVTVSGRLRVTITGSGDVTYSGNPSVERNVTGSGDVTAR